MTCSSWGQPQALASGSHCQPGWGEPVSPDLSSSVIGRRPCTHPHPQSAPALRHAGCARSLTILCSCPEIELRLGQEWGREKAEWGVTPFHTLYLWHQNRTKPGVDIECASLVEGIRRAGGPRRRTPGSPSPEPGGAHAARTWEGVGFQEEIPWLLLHLGRHRRHSRCSVNLCCPDQSRSERRESRLSQRTLRLPRRTSREVLAGDTAFGPG